jgi:hypothetical protein
MDFTENRPALNRVADLANFYFSGDGDYLGQWVKPGRGWSRYFGDSVPSNSVSRSDVFGLMYSDRGVPNWKKVFLWSMAWGHGSGYGAYRTNRVVGQIDDFDAWMSRLHDEAKSGPEAGYQWLIDNRVKGLGPAFATKLLYFVSPSSNRSPIIDALVANWLSRNGESSSEKPIGSRVFELEQYTRYIAFVDDALTRFQIEYQDKSEAHDRGFIEYLVFQDELRARGKLKRVAPWLARTL